MNKPKISLLRTYIVSALAVLVIILIVPLVIMPQLSKIREKNLQVKEGRERLEALKQKIEGLNKIDGEDESLQLFEVEKSVPSDKKLAPLIVGIRNLAGQTGLRIVEMNLKPGKVATASAVASTKTKDKTKSTQATATTAEEKDRLTLTVKLEENSDTALDKIKNFLTALEKTKRLLGVSSIGALRSSEGKTYTFDLAISTPVKQITSCEGSQAKTSNSSSCPDIVAKPLPSLSGDNENVLKYLSQLEDYTGIVVPLVPTGVENPFQ